MLQISIGNEQNIFEFEQNEQGSFWGKGAQKFFEQYFWSTIFKPSKMKEKFFLVLKNYRQNWSEHEHIFQTHNSGIFGQIMQAKNLKITFLLISKIFFSLSIFEKTQISDTVQKTTNFFFLLSRRL